MPRKKTPEIINLPAARLDEIKTKFETGAILEEDKKIILLILSTYSWLLRVFSAFSRFNVNLSFDYKPYLY